MFITTNVLYLITPILTPPLTSRYHKGGSVPDSELNASQLRARYGVQSNKSDFSSSGKGGNGDAIMMGAGVFFIVLILYGCASFLM